MAKLVRVKYETLGGSIRTRTFLDWETAQTFADKKEQDMNTQWTDIYEIETENGYQ